MRQPMVDIAETALRLGHPPTDRAAARPLVIPVDTVIVADVWISGDLGFVLLLHRRDDGLIAEELYYSTRRRDRIWERPDHLSGGIVGTELGTSAMAEDALAGASLSVVAESESLVHTGRGPDGDEGELVHTWELLVSGDADLVETERYSPAAAGTPAISRRDVAGPLMLLVLLPGERARVSAMRRENSSFTQFGNVLDLHNPESSDPH
ncbi:hypothetical protein A4E84_03415 [Streptomyces qaidamensis]|uniref:Uncharacterized protein n=1 Tax=Streptomyces qaidamensis TaxID=1783515 RepID=A0A143BUX4_9ACTN|nr:hypothetical protein [Streptomyces qaidamensis]AMW08639.1 hypothetical protein A4E84_03415 [Streptomyces qaidamensis]